MHSLIDAQPLLAFHISVSLGHWRLERTLLALSLEDAAAIASNELQPIFFPWRPSVPELSKLMHIQLLGSAEPTGDNL